MSQSTAAESDGAAALWKRGALLRALCAQQRKQLDDLVAVHRQERDVGFATAVDFGVTLRDGDLLDWDPFASDCDSVDSATDRATRQACAQHNGARDVCDLALVETGGTMIEVEFSFNNIMIWKR